MRDLDTAVIAGECRALMVAANDMRKAAGDFIRAYSTLSQGAVVELSRHGDSDAMGFAYRMALKMWRQLPTLEVHDED